MKQTMNVRVFGLLIAALMLLTLLGGAPVRATAAETAQGTPGPDGPVVEVADVNERQLRGGDGQPLLPLGGGSRGRL